MQPLLTLLLLFFFHALSFAQKIPSFGKIDKVDLEYKECSYDKDAVAECLIDYGEVNYFINNSTFINETQHRIRIKVFSEKGLDEANIKLSFYSNANRDYISNIKGVTYNLAANGEIEKTELEKKNIYRQKINENYDEMVFSLPNVKPGSVFEYSYSYVKKEVASLDNWTFQSNIPVRFSRYDAGIPGPLEFTYRVLRTLPYDEKKEDGMGSVKRLIFTMKEIPGLDREPYMSSAKDYLQRVEFQLSGVNNRPVNSSSWKELANELLDDEDFGIQIRKNILKNLPLENELKSLPDDNSKIDAIYKFVKKQIAWNGTNSYWCDKGVKNALEKHEGNSADLNLLLLNLLRDAGLTAYPVLVSTRNNGKVNPYFPFRRQFNNVYVYVDQIGNPLILDATSENNPFFISPWDVQFTNGFLVDKSIGQILNLGDLKHRFKINTIFSAEIDNNGLMKGDAHVMAYEYAKVERLNFIRKGKDDFKKEYFTNPHPQVTFDTINYNQEANDSLPLENKVKFTTQLNSSGDYFFFSPNFLAELDANPFLSEKRFTDVEFGYTQHYTINANIRFPAELELEELPKNITMIMPDTSIILRRFIQKNENSISLRITLEIKRPTYFADEYPDFKEFYTQLYDKLNEQIVFKKKAKPKP